MRQAVAAIARFTVIGRLARNDRFWPKADHEVHDSDVRFRGETGHPVRLAECLEMTQSGHRPLNS